MGLFSFVKDAGGKLGVAVYDMLHDEEDLNKPVTISPERMNEIRTKSIEAKLAESLGDGASSVQVNVAGDDVTLSGNIATQDLCEKAILCAGNQHGIASVDNQLTVDTPTPESKFYTVKSGDTLGGIAKQMYQNAGKYPVIFEANKPMLSDPNKIYPGQVLRIPEL